MTQTLRSPEPQSSSAVAVRRTWIARSAGLAVLATLFACSTPRQAAAEHWVFAPSYFSHALPEGVGDDLPVPQSRSAYRRPYIGNRPGFSIRGGYRYNRVQLRAGNSFDTTVLRSDWFEVYP